MKTVKVPAYCRLAGGREVKDVVLSPPIAAAEVVIISEHTVQARPQNYGGGEGRGGGGDLQAAILLPVGNQKK